MQDNKIVLPRTTKEGKPRVSYSQVKNFNAIKSFNLGVEGKLEYMVDYFLGYTFPDVGWGEFGQDTEDYIGERAGADKFTDAEKSVLEKIEPLGVLSDKFSIDYGEFVLTGIIDDRSEDWSKIRDYKTASKNSSKQYYEDDYVQLDIYALAGLEITGVIPELEVCVIERKGNAMFGAGRDALKVGKEIWYIPRQTSEERLDAIKQNIFKTVVEISEYYKLFLKLNTVQNGK
jgi:hypothetical protein